MMVDTGSFTEKPGANNNKAMGDTIVIRSVQSTLKSEPKFECKSDQKRDIKNSEKTESKQNLSTEKKAEIEQNIETEIKIDSKPAVKNDPKRDDDEFADISVIELAGSSKNVEPEKDEKTKKGSVLKRLAAKFNTQRKKDYQEPDVKTEPKIEANGPQSSSSYGKMRKFEIPCLHNHLVITEGIQGEVVITPETVGTITPEPTGTITLLTPQNFGREKPL